MNKKRGGQRWVVGTHSCLEALQARGSWVDEVVVFEGKKLDSALQKAIDSCRSPVKTRGKKFFNDLTDGHQGVAVAMNQRPRWELSSASRQCLVFLDGINDPHNLGAILRTAWLLDIGGLFVPKNRSVSLTSTVCKIACGGAEHVPVEEVHFQSQIEELKENGFWIFGLSEKADENLYQKKLPEKTAFIVGAEGSGLRSSTMKFCDELIAIPQVNQAASLNASVAFSLAAYEFGRHNF